MRLILSHSVAESAQIVLDIFRRRNARGRLEMAEETGSRREPALFGQCRERVAGYVRFVHQPFEFLNTVFVHIVVEGFLHVLVEQERERMALGAYQRSQVRAF